MATEYKTLTRSFLHKIKYKGNYAILTELLNQTLISEKIKSCLEQENIQIVTEVPMHKYKQNQRGFNQATLTTQWVQKNYNIPHQSILNKIRQTPAQMSLSREERLFNVTDVFELTKDAHVSGKNILLVDDVTTTGSTLEECAKILKQHNAGKIVALVIASRR